MSIFKQSFEGGAISDMDPETQQKVKVLRNLYKEQDELTAMIEMDGARGDGRRLKMVEDRIDQLVKELGDDAYLAKTPDVAGV